MTFMDLFGWVAFGLNVWGNLALTNQSSKGWIIRLTSNAAWLVYSASVGAWPLFGNHAVFTAINILGWIKWQKAAQDKEAPKASAQLATEAA